MWLDLVDTRVVLKSEYTYTFFITLQSHSNRDDNYKTIVTFFAHSPTCINSIVLHDNECTMPTIGRSCTNQGLVVYANRYKLYTKECMANNISLFEVQADSYILFENYGMAKKLVSSFVPSLARAACTCRQKKIHTKSILYTSMMVTVYIIIMDACSVSGLSN